MYETTDDFYFDTLSGKNLGLVSDNKVVVQQFTV